jgi:hypothetical protein
MTNGPITRQITGPCRNPCALPYHQPGRRVMWQVWSNETNQWRWNRGTVLAHVNRTLVVDVGNEQTVTSCGPVMEAK